MFAEPGRMASSEIGELAGLPLDALESCARVPFRLVADREALMRDFAASILAEVRAGAASGRPVRLILPVGPVDQYRLAVEISNREGLSWRHVHVFGMDEFLDWQGRPLPEDHALSFAGFMRSQVFAKLDRAIRIPESQVNFPDPFAPDAISDAIRKVGGIDCCFGGIGYHGHVAFNEPPISRWHSVSVAELRRSLTRVVHLGDDSIVVQSIHCTGGNSAAIPPMAVTLGMADILASRRLRLYCSAGERHRTIFRITVAGEVCVEYPSTLVQGHPDAEVVTDTATAQPVQPSLA